MLRTEAKFVEKSNLSDTLFPVIILKLSVFDTAKWYVWQC